MSKPPPPTRFGPQRLSPTLAKVNDGRLLTDTCKQQGATPSNRSPAQVNHTFASVKAPDGRRQANGFSSRDAILMAPDRGFKQVPWKPEVRTAGMPITESRARAALPKAPDVRFGAHQLSATGQRISTGNIARTAEARVGARAGDPRSLNHGLQRNGTIQGRFARPAALQPFGTVQRGGNSFALPPGFTLPRGAGTLLPEAVRHKMETAFGADFSSVRVHVGPEAPAIGALAFTIGETVVFAPGQYDPVTLRGQQLLGHELAHVIQQRAGRVRNPFGGGVAVVMDAALEAEADRMGWHAVRHVGPAAQHASAPQRIGTARPASAVHHRGGSGQLWGRHAAVQRTSSSGHVALGSIRVGTRKVLIAKVMQELQDICNTMISTIMECYSNNNTYKTVTESDFFDMGTVRLNMAGGISGFADATAVGKLARRQVMLESAPLGIQEHQFYLNYGHSGHSQLLTDFNRQGATIFRHDPHNSVDLDTGDFLSFPSALELKQARIELEDAEKKTGTPTNLKKCAALEKKIKGLEILLVAEYKKINNGNTKYTDYRDKIKWLMKESEARHPTASPADVRKDMMRYIIRTAKGNIVKRDGTPGNIDFDVPIDSYMNIPEFTFYVNQVMFGSEGFRNPIMYPTLMMFLRNIKAGKASIDDFASGRENPATVKSASVALSAMAQSAQLTTR